MASVLLRSRHYLSSSYNLTKNIRNSSPTLISDQKKWQCLARPFSSKSAASPGYGGPFRSVWGALQSATTPFAQTLGGIFTRSFNMIPIFGRKSPSQCAQEFRREFRRPAVVKVKYRITADNGDVVLLIIDQGCLKSEVFRSSSGMSEDELKRHVEEAKSSFEKYHNRVEDYMLDLELGLTHDAGKFPAENVEKVKTSIAAVRKSIDGYGKDDITLDIEKLKSVDVKYNFGVDGGDVILSVKNTVTGKEEQFRSSKMYTCDVANFLKEAQIHL